MRWLGAGVVLALAAGGGAWYAGWIPGLAKPGAEKSVAKKSDEKAAGQKKPGEADKDLGPPLQFVATEVTQAIRAPMAELIAFSGPLVAPNSAQVRAKASGTLLSLTVQEGSRVRAGQLLGSIDVADATSRVAEREAMLQAQRAALAQAERTHASNVALAQQNFISPSALDASKASLETARAQANAAQASLNTARVGLRDGAIVAPFAGIVAKRQAQPGERMSMEQPVVHIVDLSRLELAGTVGTHEVSRLRVGQPVQVKVEGSDKPVQADIARIAPAAEPGTRAIGVTLALANPKEEWRAGQYAVGTVTLADPQPRLSLPASALTSVGGQSAVWLIEAGVLKRRAVVTGRRDEAQGRVEIVEGLSADAVVLAARFENLREGQKASVVSGRTLPPAATASQPAASAATLSNGQKV
jgi:RND family efflux transporter MFP subunit